MERKYLPASTLALVALFEAFREEEFLDHIQVMRYEEDMWARLRKELEALAEPFGLFSRSDLDDACYYLWHFKEM